MVESRHHLSTQSIFGYIMEDISFCSAELLPSSLGQRNHSGSPGIQFWAMHVREGQHMPKAQRSAIKGPQEE